MIGALSGRLAEKQPSRLVVDVQGVGYEVQVPLSTFYGLGDVGSDVSLRVHTHVREDALGLFGFATKLELQLFERLIAISGVGPRLALAVLSGIEPPELVRAVRAGDVVVQGAAAWARPLHQNGFPLVPFGGDQVVLKAGPLGP